MVYKHGTYSFEASSGLVIPNVTQTAQVVIGTAPVNLVADRENKVNRIIVATDYTSAVGQLGYSNNFKDYTLCEAIDVNFNILSNQPVIFINVLDPEIHKTSVTGELIKINESIANLNVEGVLLDTISVKKDETTNYILDEDYVATFNVNGTVDIAIISSGTITEEIKELSVTYDKLAPEKVSELDIIGGIDISTRKKKGLELVAQINAQTGITPSLLIAPGWSHMPTVGAFIMVKSVRINGTYSLMSILDVDTAEVNHYEDVEKWKIDNGYIEKNSIACYPKRKLGDKQYYFSTVLAAEIANLDYENEGIPYKSPSNKTSIFGSTVLESGEEIFMDREEANILNSKGVVTAINLQGWRTWGNNTACFPNDTQPESRWIMMRRMFIWQGNRFINEYFKKVDEAYNRRLIEAIVDEENIYGNTLKGIGAVASMQIKLSGIVKESDIYNGQVKFEQRMGLYSPAENISNTLIFDPQPAIDEILG